MSNFLLAIFMCLAVLAASGHAQDKKDKPKPKTEPDGVPLELKIVAKKTTYKLDLVGKTTDDFVKLLKEGEKGGDLPAAPAVEMTLELKNTGAKDVEVWIAGDPVQIGLDLQGQGAVSVRAARAFTSEFRAPKPVKLEAGKTHSFEIKSLSYGFRGMGNQAHWTAVGDYTLGASIRTAMSPAPKGADDAKNSFGYVTIRSDPVKIKIEK